MNKIVFLSISLLSFNAVWTSLPSSFTEPSTDRASSVSSYSTNATWSNSPEPLESSYCSPREPEKDMTILIISKPNPPSTTFLAHDGSSKGVVGILHKIFGPKWTTNPQDLVGQVCTDYRGRAISHSGCDEFCFNAPLADSISCHAVTYQECKALPTCHEQPNSIMKNAIYQLHEFLKDEKSDKQYVMPGMPQKLDLSKVLRGDAKSVWHAHYDPSAQCYMSRPSPYSFRLAKLTAVLADEATLRETQELSPHCQDLEVDVASFGDAEKK